MAQPQGVSSTAGGRRDGSIGTASVAGDFVIGAGWGTVATISVLAGSNDQRGQITITASTTGVSQATATVVHSFRDGAWAAAPWCRVACTNDNSLTAAAIVKVATPSTTACTWTFQVLPVDTKVYIMNYDYTA